MPFIQWIEEIFNEPQAPYTMAEIIHRLQEFYAADISRSAVYRAHDSLRASESTADLVKPLDEDARPHLFSAAAARRIARRATQSKPPTRFIELPKTSKIPPEKLFETSMGRQRDANGISATRARISI